MIISQFDILKGVYQFEEKNLDTRFHRHPVLEIVIAKEGFFHLHTPCFSLQQLRLGIIMPNQSHRLEAVGATCEIICLEYFPAVIKRITRQFSIHQPIWGFGAERQEDIEMVKTSLTGLIPVADHVEIDQRINACLNYIRLHLHQPTISLNELADMALLSASRLSHLFKQETGMSVQQFIVWERMKKSIFLLLGGAFSLTDVLYQAGFYDAAHFNRHFKAFFGLPPSAVYNNSRIVQY